MSPSPSVKNVVPLKYMSVQKVDDSRNETATDPAAQWSKAKLKINPTAHMKKSSKSESGP
jgi:hypothetical protein